MGGPEGRLGLRDLPEACSGASRDRVRSSVSSVKGADWLNAGLSSLVPPRKDRGVKEPESQEGGSCPRCLPSRTPEQGQAVGWGSALQQGGRPERLSPLARVARFIK